ncbi:MAG: type IV pilin-like G/H family protein, partial [Coleofasciculaceae cyanobacterium]
IALPSFLNCGDKAKQAEAKTYVGSMSRAQQANFEEKKAFASSFEALDLGIASQTVNYNYSIQKTKTASLQYAIPRQKSLKSYVGGVFVIPATTNKSEMKTASILCEALKSGLTTPIAPKSVKGVPTCGTGTKDIRKH